MLPITARSSHPVRDRLRPMRGRRFRRSPRCPRRSPRLLRRRRLRCISTGVSGDSRQSPLGGVRVSFNYRQADALQAVARVYARAGDVTTAKALLVEGRSASVLIIGRTCGAGCLG